VVLEIFTCLFLTDRQTNKLTDNVGLNGLPYLEGQEYLLIEKCTSLLTMQILLCSFAPYVGIKDFHQKLKLS